VKVFISWSKDVSKQVAHALRGWLPVLFETVQPYMSDHDNEAGVRWRAIIYSELEKTDFGILCLTPDNLTSPWLLFEAGALSKSVAQGHVVPLLYGGLTPANIESPLGEFMGKQANYEGIWNIVRTINRGLTSPRADQALEEAFEGLWPRLERRLDAVSYQPAEPTPERPERDLLEEALEILRGLRRVLPLGSITPDLQWFSPSQQNVQLEPFMGQLSMEIKARQAMEEELDELPAGCYYSTQPYSKEIKISLPGTLKDLGGQRAVLDRLDRLGFHVVVIESQPAWDEEWPEPNVVGPGEGG
jgi:hypothetical protein